MSRRTGASRCRRAARSCSYARCASSPAWWACATSAVASSTSPASSSASASCMQTTVRPATRAKPRTMLAQPM
eukprot:6855417-Prymnesium_polylepis.1